MEEGQGHHRAPEAEAPLHAPPLVGAVIVLLTLGGYFAFITGLAFVGIALDRAHRWLN